MDYIRINHRRNIRIFISRRVFEKEMKKNPPVNEENDSSYVYADGKKAKRSSNKIDHEIDGSIKIPTLLKLDIGYKY